MNAAKQNTATPLRPIELTVNPGQKPFAKNSIEFSPNGVSFPSQCYMSPFTEVQVRVRLPRNESHHTVRCAGVVVECAGNKFTNQYQVSVAFLNVPKSIENQFRLACQRAPSKTSATKSNHSSSQ